MKEKKIGKKEEAIRKMEKKREKKKAKSQVKDEWKRREKKNNNKEEEQENNTKKEDKKKEEREPRVSSLTISTDLRAEEYFRAKKRGKIQRRGPRSLVLERRCRNRRSQHDAKCSVTLVRPRAPAGDVN